MSDGRHHPVHAVEAGAAPRNHKSVSRQRADAQIYATGHVANKKSLHPDVHPLVARTPARTRVVFWPSVKARPFVSREWKNSWPKKMWAYVPTGNYAVDSERGKLFATLTISAMIADSAAIADQPFHHRALELIFKSIIEDAIRRKAKGGKGSRLMSAAVHGYLETLAKFITDHCRGA